MRLFRGIAARPLAQRLLFSYLVAFATVIIVFAIVVRFSFSSILQREITQRLATLARAGTASIAFTKDGFTLDAHTLGGFDVRPHSEGLQWFDAAKRLKVSRGRAPQRYVAPELGRHSIATRENVLETYTLPLRDARGVDRGYVRASETTDALAEGSAALDIGLAAGSILAIIVAGFGGAALARDALARTEASFERLREFTADASHELRSPLAALSTTAAVALREAPLSAATQARLAAIGDIAAEMRRLVDDLLILARAGRSLEQEMFAVRVDTMLAGIHARYAPVAERKTIAFDLDPGEPVEIIGSPEQLARIVTNLVENALQYTPAAGSVRVACTHDGGSVHFIVSDTGLGIAPEHQDRVFDRFWRANPARDDGGAGLGLAIARALAERHGGDITVTSKPGAGSVFTFTLPRRPPTLS